MKTIEKLNERVKKLARYWGLGVLMFFSILFFVSVINSTYEYGIDIWNKLDNGITFFVLVIVIPSFFGYCFYTFFIKK